jgi:hypothetical protein
MRYIHIIRYIYIYNEKENEVGGACSTHGSGEECVQGFDEKSRKEETTWKTKA